MEDGKKVVELNPKKEGNPEFALADLGYTQEQISKIRNMVKTERERILAGSEGEYRSVKPRRQ
ncbi:TPA: hypothetical protein QDB51_003420 [Burkholderia vietnamiensis]|nr:hypothetical protein [Burkholderia vietnamiensis]